jgi:dUTPase
MTKKAETIKFLKVRKVKSPTRAFEFDAGIDFFVPEFNKLFIEHLKEKNPLVFEDYSIDENKIMFDSGSTSGILTMSQDNGSKIKYDLTDNNDSIIKFDDKKGENYFLLPPHSRVLIPSGIKSRMYSPGRALIAGNKSGIATKNGLVFGAQVVDYTYQGEIHLSLINTSTKNVRIYENMKILQFMETPIFYSPIEIIDGQDDGISKNANIRLFYEGLKDDRGPRGFGSTNKVQE